MKLYEAQKGNKELMKSDNAKICIKNSAIYNLTNAHHDRQVHGYG